MELPGFSQHGHTEAATERRLASSVLLRMAWGTWSIAKGQALPDSRSPGPCIKLLALQVSLYTSGLRSTATEPQKNVQATKTEEYARYTRLTGETQVHHSVFRCQAHKTGMKIRGEEWHQQDEWDILCSHPHPNSTLTSIHPQTKMPWRRCGVGTLCQGTWEKYHPPKCQAISLQTLVSAMDSKVAHELAPAAPEHTGSRANESLLGNPQSPVKKFLAHHWAKKKKKKSAFGSFGGKRTSVTFPHVIFSQGSTAQCQEAAPATVPPLRWGVRACVWVPSFPSCRKEVHFSPTSVQVLSLGSRKRLGRTANQTLRRCWKGHRSY